MPEDDRTAQKTRPRANRLAAERSLYLRQHAGNPVDWHPWSDEAFTEAVRLDRPVFLSIGYSSCHWCHVMERESFEDEEVAALLNADFIPVKVDREERPDLDLYYMSVCQALTGSGGWPLTVFLTPERKPFFAGTYFPKTGRYGRMGLLDLLTRISRTWKTRRADVLASAAEIAEAPARAGTGPGEDPTGGLDPGLRDEAFRSLRDEFDPEYGGFGSAPKFPIPHNLLFLLRYWSGTGEQTALNMAERTLGAMRRGGIFDQLGLGFHRYSTDARWAVPHFEKMLYDQALLAMAYTEAHQATGNAVHRSAAEDIITYVLRDLSDGRGTFASSEDADAAGEEGSFYLWTEEDVRRILPRGEADLAIRAYGIGREDPGVLTLATDPGEADPRLAGIREKMRLDREKRPKPVRDPKVLADWNGLMIAALAKAARAFGRSDYLDAAAGAADRLISRLILPGGSFLRCLDGEEARIPAFLDDHAFLAWGLLELYEAGFEIRHLESAARLARRAIEMFWDVEGGGFFFAPHFLASEVPLRRKESYDGAVPSGNAAMMLVLLRLARMTGDPTLEERAARTGAAFRKAIARSPASHTLWMSALDLAAGAASEIVLVGRRRSPDTEALLDAVRTAYLPNSVVLFKPEGDPPAANKLAELAPFVSEMRVVDGAAAAYVCSGFACRAPVTDPGKLRALLVTRSRTS